METYRLNNEFRKIYFINEFKDFLKIFDRDLFDLLMTVLRSDFHTLSNQTKTIIFEVYFEAFAETINLNETSYYEEIIELVSTRLDRSLEYLSGIG